MTKSTAIASRLQRSTAERILEMLATNETRVGQHLPEIELAAALGVSRTPVRGALRLLTRRGVLEFQPNRGFFLKKVPIARAAAALLVPATSNEDTLCIAIARDRLKGKLADECSEADLMRRYGVSRITVTGVLRQLASVGMAERKHGHGWSFISAPSATNSVLDSYRFRMIIEPAALLEPKFALDDNWIMLMRERHKEFLDEYRKFSPVSFFEMNAEFHEELARASGNVHMHSAVVQQNKLRRFINYDWKYGRDRVAVSVREHLEILDALASRDQEWASQLLRRHIAGAARVRPMGDADV